MDTDTETYSDSQYTDDLEDDLEELYQYNEPKPLCDIETKISDMSEQYSHLLGSHRNDIEEFASAKEELTKIRNKNKDLVEMCFKAMRVQRSICLFHQGTVDCFNLAQSQNKNNNIYGSTFPKTDYDPNNFYVHDLYRLRKPRMNVPF